MASWRTVEWGVIGVILLTLVASSAAVGGEGFAGAASTAVGEGTATATVKSLPTERMRIDDGRFGTNVLYLRVPDAAVHLGDVRGNPRLVYRIQVPALDVDEAATRSLDGLGGRKVTVRGVDKAFDHGQVTEDEYEATVSVRVQSFDVDETIVSVNETVEVER